MRNQQTFGNAICLKDKEWSSDTQRGRHYKYPSFSVETNKGLNRELKEKWQKKEQIITEMDNRNPQGIQILEYQLLPFIVTVKHMKLIEKIQNFSKEKEYIKGI